jgi:hypothetical protein
VSERTLERWLAEGRLHRVHREVFALGHPRIDEVGRRRAAILAYGAGTLLSHRSAAAFWGLARQRSRVIDVTAAVGHQGVRRRTGIFIHRGRLHPEDRAERGGVPVTTVARTLFDLAEFVSFKQLESAWDEADRLKLLELRAVEQVCERGYGRRALKPIRRLLAAARAPTITRSPLENDFAAFCRTHKLPAPAFNTTLPRLRDRRALAHTAPRRRARQLVLPPSPSRLRARSGPRHCPPGSGLPNHPHHPPAPAQRSSCVGRGAACAAGLAAQHFDGDFCRLGGAFADPHALRFERILLRLGSA